MQGTSGVVGLTKEIYPEEYMLIKSNIIFIWLQELQTVHRINKAREFVKLLYSSLRV